ncbi:MAG: Tyrosine-tRNA ligase [Candidatus Collierbacteria bacterium GW2011_GWC2_44_18]|uniref:Tyrosine--tRNA ligase n=1 Tax=Candidatus Collierbacteria bacterium GW2011_GWC2_44_18 TaxID=1618392 RepID=A0A0G1HPB0_9BACT|nr:MAG: Tyrosine-tRNA ligase [Microgenomates group bacterium GW2011_GWC1_44_10]KKT49016.1 MAG: Tyrosine-tRNA ligase [Candidatus Collierbacteria bacterium GW2011_GWC2_44_18]
MITEKPFFDPSYVEDERKELERRVDELLTRGVNEVIGDDLRDRLLSGEILRVKFGTDPTSPYIHIGRAVPLRKLRQFQDLGHQIVLIIGDFTGEVGDTSDKPTGRAMQSSEKISQNMLTYAEQCGKILDLSKTEVHFNSEWLNKLTFGEVCRLADMFSVSEFIQRNIIRDRLNNGQRVSARELLYPLMQGFDSVAVRADVEIGGTDQRYNLLAGREIQKQYGQRSQSVMTMNLINGLDGRKMSSSWGNVVNLMDTNIDMFGKMMSMKDEEMIDYFVHCTGIPMERIGDLATKLKQQDINPMEVKMELAFELTCQYHGGKMAVEALNHFTHTIREKNIPTELTTLEVDSREIIGVLVQSGFASTRSEAKRLILSRGVFVNDKVVESFDFELPPNVVLRKGKRAFVRVL